MKTQQLLQQVDQCIERLDSIVAGEKELVHGSSLPQIIVMLHELRTIRKELITGKLSLREYRKRGLGREIVDSWPFDSKLGEMILAVEQEYLDLPEQ